MATRSGATVSMVMVSPFFRDLGWSAAMRRGTRGDDRVAESGRLAALGHLDDLVRDEPVRLPMDRGGSFLARGLNQAEDLAGVLVIPVLQVAHAVGPLHLEIPRVRSLDRHGGQAVNLVMHVHVECNDTLSLLGRPWPALDRAPHRVGPCRGRVPASGE